ncbi:predicted protein [Nematostella vectensis]|uniref:Isoleucine--tRNA ligase, cytoplasmic n=1 Tax=Nematostella vectensis TaxID=45351 RepID=A7SCA3_NEMVE|nr:predicted protein [Nematostella vectensis]|eukprot:XP_001630713.1 predicted protein [Nematostella vectensis]
MASAVSEQHNFPKEEEKILELWKKLDAFKSSLRQSEGRPRYTFYDGPPFATGLPHYGHILAGTIKDIVTRYAHQTGYHVERRFGWDCHGLPVVYDVAKMGIAKYNDECRKIVMRYSTDWERIVSRLGRWIDFENDYKTLYPWFMETVWWVFKQLHEKNMVYRGFKVMPYSTVCNTPLSNFESNQNYKEVQDPAVFVSFPLDESPDVSMIAWTTTPWTLPSNLALVVNKDMEYVKVKDNSTEKVYIMMAARLDALFKTPEEYTVLERFKGASLEGKTYKPMFPYFEQLKSSGAFRILTDSYVTEESGTGVVHSAPAFGEDDYRVSMANGVIHKGGSLPCPVDANGKFTAEVTDFAGQYVKDADKHIIKWLKQHRRLVHQSTIKHNYPFCWRSDTPLIYKAVPGWFIRVESIVDKLLANNQKCYWVPEFVKEKRFHNWLQNAHDWNVSRNRYWGTPIPLWVSDDYQEVVCVGSVDELAELSGVRLTDLHRENVDHVTIPSKTGRGVLRRVPEVFDCWFESGSMPYAQVHYPFERKEDFEKTFPADFIAEGIDQTRGWFYTLLVISTALFDKPPFKNLIVNGLVLAADGAKMSKRKKNYPDPMEIINKHGSDALRLYLINSPVVRAETLKFQEKGVKDVVKDVFLPWYNAYRFLSQSIDQFQRVHNVNFAYDENNTMELHNIMDKWILSFTQSLVQFVHQEMDAYRLYTVVPRLVKFIEYLTNWYVRFNRKRLKGDQGQEDAMQAIQTLFGVVLTITKLMAPFTPFLTEHIYQNMKPFIVFDESEKENDSIHYLMVPKTRENLIHTEIERAVSRMQATIELGRVVRDRMTIPTKYPLPEVVIIHQDKQCLEDVISLQNYIKEELNVRKVTVSSDKDKFGLRLRAEPDSQTLGRRLKGAFKQVFQAVKELTDEELKTYEEKGELTVCGHVLSGTDLKLAYSFDQNGDLPLTYEPHSDSEILILLDVTPDQKMLDEGLAREFVNRIQKLRKKAGLQPVDDVSIVYEVEPSGSQRLGEIINAHKEYIQTSVKQPVRSSPLPALTEIIHEQTDIKGEKLRLWIFRGHVNDDTITGSSTHPSPVCRFVNVELRGGKPGNGIKSCNATVLLENPQGDHPMTLDRLSDQVKAIFALGAGQKLEFSHSQSGDEVLKSFTLRQLHGAKLYAFVKK